MMRLAAITRHAVITSATLPRNSRPVRAGGACGGRPSLYSCSSHRRSRSRTGCSRARRRDGLPALVLVIDPADSDVLLRSPRDPAEPILGKAKWRIIPATSLLQAATTLGIFFWALRARDLSEARNLAFNTLVFGELFRAFAARSPTRLFWEVGVFTSVRLLAVVVASVVLQLVMHHTAVAQRIFAIKPLSLTDCILTLSVAFVPVTLTELGKLLRRRKPHDAP